MSSTVVPLLFFFINIKVHFRNLWCLNTCIFETSFCDFTGLTNERTFLSTYLSFQTLASQSSSYYNSYTPSFLDLIEKHNDLVPRKSLNPLHHHYVPSHQEDVPIYYPKDHTPVFDQNLHSRTVPVFYDQNHFQPNHHEQHQSLITSYEHLYYPESHQVYQGNIDSKYSAPNSFTYNGLSRGYNYNYYSGKFT